MVNRNSYETKGETTKLNDDRASASLREKVGENPAPKRTEQPCWTEIEVEQILSAAQDPQKSIYTIYADTGMRFANCNG